ncbi:putative leucine-rich repeat-containing protein DDB_G0290503 [Agrilus planipennis]|uniref:Leucine-rich repeat-containing protein DDB_G0290503 n=1 Tax=Agrilus planipennis TaxID=224129 RepID=A0A7F5RA61_AGRPL|nr:putative leucine-rich repeat-containing protein DDB_G0290503 [Agrilus planipennis]
MTSNDEIENLSNSKADNLGLGDINVPEIPSHIIFPNELNLYLRDQVQCLMFEKGKLQKKIVECEEDLTRCKCEITLLKSKLEQYEQLCAPNSNYANLANTYNCKIVELSKTLREKSCELEKYKTKCSKLEQTIVEFQKNDKEAEVTETHKDAENEDDSENKIKYLQDNLNFTKAKLCEARNINLKLKNDLKFANKLLLQEIGDNFDTIQKNICTAGSNWRGRAQIICDLQQKNNELKEKLKLYQDKDQGKVDLRKDDNKKIDALQQENQNLRKVLEDTKKKLDVLRARCKVYESESIMLKTKLSVTAEQNEKNNKIITHLTSQISDFHEKQNSTDNEKQKLTNNLEKENKNLKLQLSKEKCLLEKLQKELDMKISCIEMLKRDSENKKNASYFDSTNADIRKLEGERIRLVELTEMLNKRLENEKEAHFKTQSNYLFERHRAAKLEAKLARVKTEGCSTNRSSNYSTTSSRQFNTNEELENRLELANETIKSLETKLNLEKQERVMDFEKFTEILKYQTINSASEWD